MIYKTPGVFIEEITTLPPSVAPVSTAIPAFIGYTEKAGNDDPLNRPLDRIPTRISSFVEYVRLFGGAPFQAITIFVEGSDDNTLPVRAEIPLVAPSSIERAYSNFRMYHQLIMYFQNGGGPCYIISVGSYVDRISKGDLDETLTPPIGGLAAAKKIDEITLLLFPDASGLPDATYYGLYIDALKQCADLKDRFTIIDVRSSVPSPPNTPISVMRNAIGINNLSYGAAYHPYLRTNLSYSYQDTNLTLVRGTTTIVDTDIVTDTDRTTLLSRNDFRSAMQVLIANLPVVLPPSGAIAGIYAQVDRTRGVFKAPANVSLNAVIAPTEAITNEDQEDLNIHFTGKSINVIRSFSGKGVLVWGARTLDGNSSEWKYISVRRFFIFVEESIQKAIESFVFEPNNASTWTRIKGLIENFLILQWRAGALAGGTAQQAFQVNIGLGETMTAQDILDGRLIVDVGLAVVRPAEFIILRFTHKLQEA